MDRSTLSDTEREAILRDSTFLRVHELQNGQVQFTDSTTAHRLLKEHGKDIRYIAPWKKWLVWNGNHWQLDSGTLIHEKGLATVRNIYSEINKTGDYRERYDIERFGIQSESARRREQAIKSATWIKELNADTEELDRNPWLLNVENGTVNLKNGELLPHKQEDMITKIAKVKYDKEADCPMWKTFIREIMDYRGDLITFLQTAVGWAISGDISEQSMFFAKGQVTKPVPLRSSKR